MSCTIKSLNLPPMTVAWNSTNSVAIPAGPGWFSAAGLAGGRGWGEMSAKNGNLRAVPGIQLTNDVNDPTSGTTTAVGSLLSADGVSVPNGVNALSTGGYRFARPVWILSLSSGTDLATACVSGTIELIFA